MAENTAGQTHSSQKPVKYANFAIGTVTFDATAIVAADYTEITCGFTPRKVIWSNDTDRVELTWRHGMADNSCIKAAAAGTRTLETANGITVVDGGFRVSQNATLAGILASKTCRWEAHA